MTQKEIENLLTYTNDLLNQTFWIKQDFETKPEKEHIGASITYSDILERREEFTNCLLHTINSFVYNKKETKALIKKFFEDTEDYGNASAKLTFSAKSKFRPGHPQGQFGELLLFNFIQHFFKATPLLRKMSITTSNMHERFGADAIHYKVSDTGENVIILGESKCYKSAYKFNSAFKDSLISIASSFKNFEKELDLYIYEKGMIEDKLIPIAEAFKNNTLKNVKFELVCIVIYEEKRTLNKNTENEIKSRIKTIIEDRFKKIDSSTYSLIDSGILDRINYIVFPVWDLNTLLNNFMNTLGVNE